MRLLYDLKEWRLVYVCICLVCAYVLFDGERRVFKNLATDDSCKDRRYGIA